MLLSFTFYSEYVLSFIEYIFNINCQKQRYNDKLLLLRIEQSYNNTAHLQLCGSDAGSMVKNRYNTA